MWFGWRLRGLRKAAPPPSQRNLISEPTDYVRDTLAWCVQMSDAQRIVLWRLDPDENTIAPLACVGAARPAVQQLSGDPLAWAVQQNMSMRIDPVPTWSTAPRVFAVPIPAAGDGSLVLSIEIVDTVPVAPSKFDSLGLYMGAVLSVEAQRTALAREHARADDLIETLRMLPAALDLNELSQQLARAASDTVAGTGAAVTFWKRDRGSVIASDGDAPGVGATMTGSESETALAARAGATLVREPGSLGNLPLVAAGERFRRKPKALVAVPLKIAGEVVGILSAWSANEITAHAVRDLETLAPYAALQLRQAYELGQMRALAEHDALTGLNNRLAFDEFFAAEAGRYDRYQRPFSLVIFDLDHFKNVNDQYGHEGGDFILRQVAEVIRGSLRSVDFAARVGGEEFVVVLPETGLTMGLEIGERVRGRVEQLEPVWRGQKIPVRVSAGVSAIPECVERAADLVRSADQALYAAKHAGRNKVVAAGPIGTVR